MDFVTLNFQVSTAVIVVLMYYLFWWGSLFHTLSCTCWMRTTALGSALLLNSQHKAFYIRGSFNPPKNQLTSLSIGKGLVSPFHHATPNFFIWNEPPTLCSFTSLIKPIRIQVSYATFSPCVLPKAASSAEYDHPAHYAFEMPPVSYQCLVIISLHLFCYFERLPYVRPPSLQRLLCNLSISAGERARSEVLTWNRSAR